MFDCCYSPVAMKLLQFVHKKEELFFLGSVNIR
jgi:hypothetical protein